MKTGLVKSRPSRLINNSTFKFKPNEWENGSGKKYVRTLLNQHLLWIQLSYVPIKAVGIIGTSKPSGAGEQREPQLFPPPQSSLSMSPFFIRPATSLKKRLWHRYFPLNFANFLRTPFLTEHLHRLLLYLNHPFAISLKR